MAIKLKHKMLIFWMIMLGFIAFGAWHSEDMETAYWAMWTVPIIFLFVWLLFDCIFVDDKAFIFDHDYEIGSVKGPKNFCSTQTVFHRDDVPAQRRERKKDVKDWKERRILAVGQPPPWSSSVTLDPSRLKYARTKSNSDLDPGKPYRYNYRAEALPSKSPHPVPRPHRFKVSCVTEAEAEKRRAERAGYPNNAINHPKRLAEMPVNRRLDDMEAWNHSTQLGPPERRRTLEDYEAACKLATTRRARHLRAYTAPEQGETVPPLGQMGVPRVRGVSHVVRHRLLRKELPGGYSQGAQSQRV